MLLAINASCPHFLKLVSTWRSQHGDHWGACHGCWRGSESEHRNHLCRNALRSCGTPHRMLAHPADERAWPEPRESPVLALLSMLYHSPPHRVDTAWAGGTRSTSPALPSRVQPQPPEPNLPRVANPREVPDSCPKTKRPRSGQEARPHAERRDEERRAERGDEGEWPQTSRLWRFSFSPPRSVTYSFSPLRSAWGRRSGRSRVQAQPPAGSQPAGGS